MLKAPVETQETLPQVMRSVLGYEFFTIEDGTPLELDSAYGEKFAQDYNRKVGKLVEIRFQEPIPAPVGNTTVITGLPFASVKKQTRRGA